MKNKLKIDYVHFCDLALIDKKSGKLSIIGIFDNLKAKGFPAIQQKLYIVVGFNGEPKTKHTITLSIEDDKGDVSYPFTEEIELDGIGNYNFVFERNNHIVRSKNNQKLSIVDKNTQNVIGEYFLTIN